PAGRRRTTVLGRSADAAADAHGLGRPGPGSRPGLTARPPVRLLFASGKAYLPDRVDGAILSTHTLLSKLTQAGHDCEAAAGVSTANFRRAAAYRLRRLATLRRTLAWPDNENGYATWRAWEGLVPRLVQERIARFR